MKSKRRMSPKARRVNAKARSPLDRLLTEAQVAVQPHISSRRKAAEGDGTWPTTSDATELCALLARTSRDERDAFRGRLTNRQRVVLSMYGGFSLTRVVQERSRDWLRIALIATAIGDENDDPRDCMLGLASHHHVARHLGLHPSEVFDEAAAYAGTDMANLLRGFGRRTDITSKSWKFRRIDTPEGPCTC